MTDAFVSTVARGLATLQPPPRALLAVSGGADSVALLDALCLGSRRSDLRGRSWVVGHFDHAFRPDSQHDAELVERLATERNVPFLLRRRTRSQPSGLSLEHFAREERYEALISMAREAGCGAVVTAHTASDQAETFLWRLVRGAGSRGLGSMRAERPIDELRLLRPMLRLTREETRSYCARRQLQFIDDPTNENELPRARLRAEVVPVLERLQPGVALRIADAADRLREDDDLLEELAAGLLVGTPAEVLSQLRDTKRPLRRRALVRWVEAALGTRERLMSSHVEALEKLVLNGRGEVELPSDKSTRRVATILHKSLVLEARPHVRQRDGDSSADEHHQST